MIFLFSEYWWFYAAFSAFVFVLLALDLGVFHRKPHAVSFREASLSSAIWVGLALAFSGLLYWYVLVRFKAAIARQITLEFLTGYVVEETLSVDNLFVFVLIFRYFAIPAELQHRLLFYGILGTVGLRAAFIAVGSVLMQYHAVVILFGVFLVLTGGKMLFAPAKEIKPGNNLVLRLMSKIIPVTNRLEGSRFFVREGNVRKATPALVSLVLLEVTDIAFAIDSVPAIFGVTKEPLIVFTSNIFAILGLRSMYFLLAGAVERFHLLHYGLGMVLVFVGLKMVWLNQLYGGEFPIGISLGIIGGVIAVSVVLSLIFPPATIESDVSGSGGVGGV